MLKIHPIKARIKASPTKSLKRKDFMLFCFALLYSFASTATNYAPPLLALVGYLLLCALRRKEYDWGSLALAGFLCISELLHGMYLFSNLLSLVVIMLLFNKRLPYKLRKKELLIAALIFIFYAVILSINALIAYIDDKDFSAPSGLFIYYAAIEAAIACVFFKDNL